MDNLKKINVLLALKRKELGLSIRAFAKKYGFSPTVLNQIENDKIQTPTMKNLIAISNALELPIESIYEYYSIPIKSRERIFNSNRTNLINILTEYGLSTTDIIEIINYVKFKVVCSDKETFNKFMNKE